MGFNMIAIALHKETDSLVFIFQSLQTSKPKVNQKRPLGFKIKQTPYKLQKYISRTLGGPEKTVDISLNHQKNC